jgi:geranylgeranyl reductase family protein
VGLGPQPRPARAPRILRGVNDVADVVVVGGGPAGSTAAMTLAARGARVVLIDKKRFPRDKPCGGGIRWSVLRRFPSLGDHLRGRVALHEIRKVRLESPAGITVVAEGGDPFYLTLRRVEFDAALLERARGLGVHIVEHARVSAIAVESSHVRVGTIDGRAVRAALVIGADGVNSVVARQCGLGSGFADEALAIDTMEETPLAELPVADPQTMYVAYGYRGYPGYGYVFPKRDHVDAGVGFLLSFFKRRLDGGPYRHHRAFLDEARAKGVVRGASRRENFKAYRLPLGGPLARTYGERVMVCGDAGGFVNAYTGEGIYHAMVTGEHAAETAARALARGDFAAYEERWRAEVGEELFDSLRIQRRLFADPSLADRLIRAAAVDATLCRLFARVALGEEGLRRRRLEMTWRFALASVRARVHRRRRPRGRPEAER